MRGYARLIWGALFGMVAAGALAQPVERIEKATVAHVLPRVKIGVSVPAADHGWAAALGWWAKRAMPLYPNVEWVYAAAARPDKQIADIRDMMARKVDGLVVMAAEASPLTEVVAAARKQGVLVVNVDRGLLWPAADIFIQCDNEAFGRKSAEFMVRKLQGKGSIVILRGVPCGLDTIRYEAAMKVFAKTDIEVLGVLPGMWDRRKATECMAALLAKHGRIDAVWAADDEMALGCEQAIRQAGRQREMWILGGACQKDVVKWIVDRDPMYPANITYPPSMVATGMHLAVASLQNANRGKIKPFIPKHMVIDCEVVVPENARDYYFPDSPY